jgi:hypothetical protein
MLETRRTTHPVVCSIVLGINTPDCVRSPRFLKATECCPRSCPQSTYWPDCHVCITIRPPYCPRESRSCQFRSCHCSNCTGTFIFPAFVPLLAHIILGWVDLLHPGLLSPRFHRRCPISRTSSRIRHGGCIHHTHVGASNHVPRDPSDPLLLQ